MLKNIDIGGGVILYCVLCQYCPPRQKALFARRSSPIAFPCEDVRSKDHGCMASVYVHEC